MILFRGLDQTCFNGIPVDNVPNSTDVIGSDVSVIDVVGVLPDINTQQRFESSSSLQWILVWEGDNVDDLGLWAKCKPPPSASLNSNSLGRDLGHHVLVASESGVDGFL